MRKKGKENTGKKKEFTSKNGSSILYLVCGYFRFLPAPFQINHVLIFFAFFILCFFLFCASVCLAINKKLKQTERMLFIFIFFFFTLFLCSIFLVHVFDFRFFFFVYSRQNVLRSHCTSKLAWVCNFKHLFGFWKDVKYSQKKNLCTECSFVVVASGRDVVGCERERQIKKLERSF